MTKIITKRSKVYITYLYRWRKYKSIPVCRRFNPISPKRAENHKLSGAPRGHKLGTPPAKWDHHWLTDIWPVPLFHASWKHQKTKSPPTFSGGYKTRRSTRKRVKWQVKTIEDLLRGHSKTTFAQDSRVLNPSLPLVCPCLFSSTPLPHKVRSFGQELPLSPSISILVKFREKKLIMSTSIFG